MKFRLKREQLCAKCQVNWKAVQNNFKTEVIKEAHQTRLSIPIKYA